jgi:SRSO17 transposase
MSAGVARQYTGTAGRIENSQVGVFLAHAAPDGSRALIDRELYLPEKWTADRDRCRAARTGGEVAFATKPALAQNMIGRAVKAGVPFSWVAGDEVYGGNPGLRGYLEGERMGLSDFWCEGFSGFVLCPFERDLTLVLFLARFALPVLSLTAPVH